MVIMLIPGIMVKRNCVHFYRVLWLINVKTIDKLKSAKYNLIFQNCKLKMFLFRLKVAASDKSLFVSLWIKMYYKMYWKST